MRILITGSRYWPDDRAGQVTEALAMTAQGFPCVLVHGDCPTGVDRIAKLWSRSPFGKVTEEAHPAQWKTMGSAAGPLRNQEMVDAGADICLAFPLGESPGTRDCMRRARKAGIPVIEYGSD